MAWDLLNLAAMVVSALVITLASDPQGHAATMAALSRDPRITLGPPMRERVPVVCETDTAADGAALVDALAATVGVARVDVVSIDFEEQ